MHWVSLCVSVCVCAIARWRFLTYCVTFWVAKTTMCALSMAMNSLSFIIIVVITFISFYFARSALHVRCACHQKPFHTYKCIHWTNVLTQQLCSALPVEWVCVWVCWRWSTHLRIEFFCWNEVKWRRRSDQIGRFVSLHLIHVIWCERNERLSSVCVCVSYSERASWADHKSSLYIDVSRPRCGVVVV